MDSDASSRTPVAEADAVSGFQIGVVIIGISITLPLMYSAGELAQNMGMRDAIIASIFGALILSLMAVPASVVGMKSRLSSYMIIEHTFGFIGAKFINFWFGIFLLGWYAVTAELFGRTLFLAAEDLTSLALPEFAYTLLSSALVITTTIYGFKAIDRLALIAVPFLLLALVVVSVLSMRETTFAELLQIAGNDAEMTIPTAISVVVGAAMVGVVLSPDLTRYARSVRDCVTASFLGQGVGMTVAYVFGMIPVMVWGELEPMTYMIIMGFGVAALAVLVFATWTTNVINLYGVSLSCRASIPIGNYRNVTIIGGIVGTIAAVVGVSDFLIEFLIVMGLLVPPIAGVYLCNFFFLGRRDFSEEHLAARPAFETNALVVGIGAGIIASWMFFGGWSVTSIAPLDSLIIAVAAYLALEKFAGRTATAG